MKIRNEKAKCRNCPYYEDEYEPRCIRYPLLDAGDSTYTTSDEVCGEHPEFLIDKKSSTEVIPMDAGIIKLEMSARTYNALKNSGIRTVGDLVNLDASRIERIHNLGRVSHIDLLQCMMHNGLRFRNSE